MTDYPRRNRRDRKLEELDHDPYHSKRKQKEPAVCTGCGAVLHKGRWVWGEVAEAAHETLCPACHRISDRVPAAFLTLQGEFFEEHREEIMHLVENYEQRERQDHPLKRIMGMEELEDGTEITMTDAHLAHGIGEALRRAYDGELDSQYAKEDIMLRVHWAR